MANPDVGCIDCPQCGKESPVRWQKGVEGTKLYYACKNCGQFFPRLDGGQAWIKANMRPLEPVKAEMKLEPGTHSQPVEQQQSIPDLEPESEVNQPSAWDKFWNGGNDDE